MISTQFLGKKAPSLLVTMSGIEVGKGGTSQRRAVGRRSSLPPTKGRAEVQRSKVEGRRSKVEGQRLKSKSEGQSQGRSQRVEVRGSKSEGQSQ